MSDVVAPARPGTGLRVAAFVAAFLLPPLAVFLVLGLRPAFWIAILLTVFAWIPGVLFALVAVIAPSALSRLAD